MSNSRSCCSTVEEVATVEAFLVGGSAQGSEQVCLLWPPFPQLPQHVGFRGLVSLGAEGEDGTVEAAEEGKEKVRTSVTKAGLEGAEE